MPRIKSGFKANLKFFLNIIHFLLLTNYLNKSKKNFALNIIQP